MTALSRRRRGSKWKKLRSIDVIRTAPTSGGKRPASRKGSAGYHPVGRKTYFYAGYEDLKRDIRILADSLPEGCDGITGVPRSGELPAKLLCSITGIPVYFIGSVPEHVTNLVVVEDATQYMRFKKNYFDLLQAEGRGITWSAVYACGDAIQSLDLYAVEADKPRLFAWNLHKHKNARDFMYDMDGIICKDPSGREYTEPYYSHFVSNTPCLFPAVSKAGTITGTKPAIGTIVTGRKEPYRDKTEAWLRQHLAGWKGLLMRPGDAERGSEAIAAFKADKYRNSSSPIFIESSEKQAKMIHEATGKPVVCPSRGFGTRTGSMKEPGSKAEVPTEKNNDKIIYTISTGEYEKVAPPSFPVPEGWDYVRLTSKDCPEGLSPKQQSAWAKANGPLIFRGYKASLCIDDDMSVVKNPSGLFGDKEFCVTGRTPFLYQGKRIPGDQMTWVKDLDNTAELRKAATERQCQAEKRRYFNLGFKDSRDWRTGIMYREHTPQVLRVCAAWWFWYLQSETQRDQPSLAIACQQENYTPFEIPHAHHKEYFVHDVRKADRDGTRYTVESLDKPNISIPKKRLIYTVSTGRYANAEPVRQNIPEGWDFVHLKDKDCPDCLNAKQKAAWAKVNGMRIFRRYDEVLFVDDDISVTKDPLPLLGAYDFAAATRNNIPTWSEDLRKVVACRKATTEEAAEAEKARYLRLGYVDSKTYLCNTVWRKRCGKTEIICDEWWFWYLQSETRRDQPSLAIALQALDTDIASFSERQWGAYIYHDIKKADRDGTRYKVTGGARR